MASDLADSETRQPFDLDTEMSEKVEKLGTTTIERGSADHSLIPRTFGRAKT